MEGRKLLQSSIHRFANILRTRTYFGHSRDVGVLTTRTGDENNLSMRRSWICGMLDVNGCQIHYEQAGKGKNVVLMMPGAVGTARTDFRPQLAHMNRDLFTVVAWDPPGYGKSLPKRTWPDHWFERDARCAVKLMNNMGYNKYSVMGWSDGGITALILASLYPDNVQKLVVWGANAYITKEEVESYEEIGDISNWSNKMRAPYIEEYGEERFQELWKEWIEAISQYYYGDRKGDFVKEGLAKIQCPTLIVHGQKDQLVPQFHPDYLHANIKDSRLVNMPEGRHNVHLRYFKEFNALVENFIMEPSPKK